MQFQYKLYFQKSQLFDFLYKNYWKINIHRERSTLIKLTSKMMFDHMAMNIYLANNLYTINVIAPKIS